jgi:hypothetical protein
VGEGDDEERNSEEEILPLDSFFLPLNQNSLDKRVKLAVTSQLWHQHQQRSLFWTLHNPIEEPLSASKKLHSHVHLMYITKKCT